MKVTKDIKLVTVGEILAELTKYKKKHSDDVVMCELPDADFEDSGYIAGSYLDKDGDVCLFLDEGIEDSSCYDVEMLCEELQGYDHPVRVYMECNGILLSIENCCDLFEYDKDEEVVFCSTIKIGKIKKEPPKTSGNGWLTEAEIHKNEEDERRRKAKDKFENIVLIILIFGLIVGFVYHMYCIITHTGTLWYHILWSVVYFLLGGLNCLVLYYSRK